MARINVYQKGYYTFGDNSVAIGLKIEFSVLYFAGKPYPGLASFNKPVLSLFLFRKRLQGLSKLYQILIFVQPLVILGKILDNLLFLFFQCHTNILTALSRHSIKYLASSMVLYGAKDALRRPVTPKRSIRGSAHI